jgi:hypothetical protein
VVPSDIATNRWIDVYCEVRKIIWETARRCDPNVTNQNIHHPDTIENYDWEFVRNRFKEILEKYQPASPALTKIALSAVFRDGEMVITLATGDEIRFPVSRNPRLANGTEAQLNGVEISPFGLHWPELDEDLSFEGLAKGDFGQSDPKP